MTTARQFLKYAGYADTKEMLHILSTYLDSMIYFPDFPDAECLDDRMRPLKENPTEPAAFQEYADQRIRFNE